MRTRTAKKLAQRIDLDYFKRTHPFRRWRTLLSIAAPAIGLVWLGGMAVAGSRAPYSSGPVSSSHAFAEMKCEVCHVRGQSFRAHVTDTACLTCHDAPAHAPNQPPPPDCATCHREHKGRVELAATSDGFCVRCHGDLRTTGAAPRIATDVERFPSGHPEFAVARAGAVDPGTLKFNHEVHLKADLRGPSGPETLQCAACHRPEIARTTTQRRVATGLMAPVNYELQCARCHPLFFDERIDAPVPHEQPPIVRAFVVQALRDYIAKHPGDVSKPDPAPRRVPLNFPRPPEPPARSAGEWVERRAARAEELLRERTCEYCHQVTALVPSRAASFAVAPAAMQAEWMPRAKFDHAPHLMVQCGACHAAQTSRSTSDVLMPAAATCATCHAPDKGAESRCFECHGYHDWTKAKPVTPAFDLDRFR
jgi:predicted CXXCH cytochrome family protein